MRCNLSRRFSAIASCCLAFFLAASALIADDNCSLEECHNAVAGLDTAIGWFPRASLLYHLRAEAERILGEDAKAIADYDSAVRFSPKPAMVYLDRGSFYAKKGEYDAALADYNKAIELTLGSSGLFAMRALLWDAMLNRRRAIKDLDTAIRLNPKSPKLYTTRSFCWAMEHNAENALADANEAIRRAPNSDIGYRMRAFARLIQGNCDLAVADFDRVSEMSPSDSSICLNRCALHYVRGEYDKAQSLSQRIPMQLTSDIFPVSDEVKALAAAKRREYLGKPPDLKQRMAQGILVSEQHICMANGTVSLDDQGFVDFVNLLDEKYSAGVTADNNSATLLLAAYGPSSITPAERPAFFKRLGMELLPDVGVYLVSLGQYVRLRAAESRDPGEGGRGASGKWESYQLAAVRPWTDREFPLLADFLRFNERRMPSIEPALKRERYFLPTIKSASLTELPSVNAFMDPLLCDNRDLMRLLEVRLMSEIQGKRRADAVRTTLALFRLSKLVGQGKSLVDVMAACRIRESACRGMAAVLHYTRPGPLQLAVIEDALKDSASIPSFAERVRFHDRHICLDAVQRTARGGPRGFVNAIRAISTGLVFEDRPALKPTFGEPTITTWLFNQSVDWDEAWKVVNTHIDEVAIIFEMPTRRQRDAAITTLLERFKAEKEAVTKKEPSMMLLGTGFIPGEIDSADIALPFVHLILPDNLRALAIVQDRWQVDSDMANVSLALESYRTRTHEYPKRLVDLKSLDIKEIPRDLHGDCDYHYSRQSDGYALYSVGANGKDDGGRDSADNPPGDDIVFRFPRR